MPAKKPTLVGLLFNEGVTGHRTGRRLCECGYYSTNMCSPLPLGTEGEYSPPDVGLSSMTSFGAFAEGISRNLKFACAVWLACSDDSP